MSEPLAQDVLAEHFFRSSDFGPTDQVAALLSAAGIPYRVALSGLELILWIRTADRKAAEAAVGDGFVLCPPTGNQELPEGEAVACPGCGQTLREGATECPGCGLPFEAGPLPRCARCGQVLPVEEGPCPDCDG
jgi:hypothetical protein